MIKTISMKADEFMGKTSSDLINKGFFSELKELQKC